MPSEGQKEEPYVPLPANLEKFAEVKPELAETIPAPGVPKTGGPSLYGYAR